MTTESKTPTYPMYEMRQSCYLKSTGRSVQMTTRVTPSSPEENDELAAFAKLGRVCVVVGAKKMTGKQAAKASEASDGGSTASDSTGSNVSPEDELVKIPGIGKASLSKLKEMDIKSKEELIAALKNPETLKKLKSEIGAPNVAKWTAHLVPADAKDDDKGDALPKSSRENSGK